MKGARAMYGHPTNIDYNKNTGLHDGQEKHSIHVVREWVIAYCLLAGATLALFILSFYLA